LKIVRTVTEMQGLRVSLAEPLGLVPTMGALHEGHLSLVRESRRRDATTITTIFVNPAQFGPSEDFAAYPRDETRDLALLEAAGVAVVFTPSREQIYPRGFETYVDVTELTTRLEGASRPGHLRGVATVVLKLLNITGPTRGYFGRKDAQQLRVIRRMAKDLDLGVEVVGMPIVREADGLAMSSRNRYLSPDERRAAPVLSRGLFAAKGLFDAGEREAAVLRGVVLDSLEREPLVRVDYVSLADDTTLCELDRVETPALLSLAAFAGQTRLIDNVELASHGEG
jgi:pantoate--beta-alanine ligase